LLCAFAHADDYPSKPIRFLLPYPPGGGNDFVARTVATRLAENLRQQVGIANRGGAHGIIATDLTAKSPPDGYTLFFGSVTSLAINVSAQKDLPYDPLKDFAPVTFCFSTPLYLVTNINLPATSVKELIALAKAKPGKLNFGSSGTGGSNHLAGELFDAMAGVKMVHIPYKGNAGALTDIVGGHLDVVYNGITSAVSLIRGGKLRALAVTSLQRSSALPDVPTLDESGLKGFEAVAWNGLTAPAKTPRDIVMKINADVIKIVSSPELRERLKADGSDPVGNSPEQYSTFVRDDIAKWAKVVKESGAKVD